MKISRCRCFAPAAQVVVLHKQNGRAIALPFRFLVGTQKFTRVTNVLTSAFAIQVKVCEATT